MPNHMDVFASRVFWVGLDNNKESVLKMGKFGQHEPGSDGEAKPVAINVAEEAGIRIIHPKRHTSIGKSNSLMHRKI